MKKYFAVAFILFLVFPVNAQTRGIKIGYIDMEYILQNVPDYTEAKNQLEQKAQKWKQEIESKKNEISGLKDALTTERALLTKELVSEREEEIKFKEDELIDFQQKKFGPNGDLITQKSVLVKPIQDQVFTAVQDIAEIKKYDYIFDKSSDLTMLFAAKRLDISDQVIRAITRSSKRDQLSKKELKEQEAKEYKEDVEDENPALTARKKALEEKKLAREKLIEDKKLAAEAKKLEQEENRKQLLEERDSKKTGIIPANVNSTEIEKKSTESVKTAAETAAESREAKAAERARIVEERKKALEEKIQKAIEEREDAKKAREELKTN